MATIFEILENNIILASNEDLGLLLSCNGSYFQVWRQLERSGFECLDALHLGSRFQDAAGSDHVGGLYGIDSAKLWTKAEDILTDWIKSSEVEND